MKNKKLVLILLFYCCFIPFSSSSQAMDNDYYSSIMSNICNVQWMNATKDVLSGEALLGMLQKQSPDGSWPDIDYGSHRQTAWVPSTHLVRLHNIVLAYSYRKGKLYNDRNVLSAIERGLQYWYDTDPRSTNWWNQQIFCPKQIGEILILLRSSRQDISKQLEQKLLERMEKIGGDPEGQYSEGGSNRINIAAHWIYRGCLNNNQSVLEKGVRNYLLPVNYCSPGRGLQKDMSFQEHGRQLYIGNYGYAFVDNISEGALFLRNTPWALSGTQLKLFSDFVLNTFLNSIRGPYYSFSIQGRQVANKDALLKGKNTALLDRMVLIDPVHQSKYVDAKKRWEGRESPDFNIPIVHKHFWISDYTVHNRPNYNFDVRFVSYRTVRTENVNYENKKGFFLADGATNMTIRGDEYYNIFPVWDWCKIPGTTAPLLDTLPNMPKKTGGAPGITDFSGGVSDSVNGVSTYALDYPAFNIKGKKSWFFFDNEIVCLGNSIQSTSNAEIGTTVNQCISKGKIQIKQNNTISAISSRFSDDNGNSDIQWVLHDGFGYFFPGKNSVHISDKQQQGSWLTISDSQKDIIAKEKVFTLWLDHGKNPGNASYAYIIVPNMKNTDQMDTYQKNAYIQILANTDSLQEVLNTKDGIKEAVLFKKDIQISLDENYSLIFDQPCLLLVKRVLDKWIVYVADPTQSLKKITGKLYDKKRSGYIKSYSIALPESNSAGSSVQLTVQP